MHELRDQHQTKININDTIDCLGNLYIVKPENDNLGNVRAEWNVRDNYVRSPYPN